MKLVLATRNPGKIQEIHQLLKNQRGLELLSFLDYPEAPVVSEDGDTYEDNATKKASVIAEYTGHLTLADDSGLEVDALNGAPGVHSARYAGENASDAERVKKLLDAVRGIPDDRRTARFKCVIAIVEPHERASVVEGTYEGYIIRTPRGNHGFGYDPIFVPSGYDRTFAELGEVTKNKISHRAKALTMAVELLRRKML